MSSLIWEIGVFDPFKGQDLCYRNVKSILVRRAECRHGGDGSVRPGPGLSPDAGVRLRLSERWNHLLIPVAKVVDS
jgi:hypothetical protein